MKDSVSEQLLKDIEMLKARAEADKSTSIMYQKYLDEKFDVLNKNIESLVTRFADENKTIFLTLDKVKEKGSSLENRLSHIENELENGRIKKGFMLALGSGVVSMVTLIGIVLDIIFKFRQ